MQGTVWGSLCCTVSMDKLGQHVYKNKDLLYRYKGEVEIPSLGMVDDIMTIQKCSNDSVKINAVVNAFVEAKKLRLSKDKCHKIHIQKNNNQNKECLKLKVHNEDMSDSAKERYLGDIVDSSGKIRSTVEERRNKGFGMVAEILAIVNDIPLGQYKMEIGLKLRQAMLLNGLLFNSEAWHDITEAEIKLLEAVDEHLLRSLVGGHAKTPLEFLYLEAGAIPIRFILSCRRMIYLQAILKRDDEELTKRVYRSQKQSPIKGDFFNLVKKDFDTIGQSINEDEITAKSKEMHKSDIKSKIKTAAFQYLREKQSGHSKVRDIAYEKLETQRYMTSPLFTNQEMRLLFAMRSKALDCRTNFKNRYRNDDLLCEICLEEDDDQPHIMRCKPVNSKLKSQDVTRGLAKYEDIYGDPHKQKVISVLFTQLLEIRKTMVEDNRQNTPDPSISAEMLKTSYDLQPCTVNYSSRT